MFAGTLPAEDLTRKSTLPLGLSPSLGNFGRQLQLARKRSELGPYPHRQHHLGPIES